MLSPEANLPSKDFFWRPQQDYKGKAQKWKIQSIYADFLKIILMKIIVPPSKDRRSQVFMGRAVATQQP